jgi:aryl-alcohol dehydrogenase-like predicted oxidoreductase
VKNKIILGTVQLGLPYGINNKRGQPSREEAFEILDFAFDHDIRTLDSADGYGEALRLLGEYKVVRRRDFLIINKFKLDGNPLEFKLSQSLQLLKAPSVNCYMYHHFNDYVSGKGKTELAALRTAGRIDDIGVSLYDVGQLRLVVDDPLVSVIQIPVNLLDLSAEKEGLLKKASTQGKKIHARSVYLQGLLFRDPATLTGNLKAMAPYLSELRFAAALHNTGLMATALNFVLRQEYVTHLVLGVEHVQQLRESLNAVDATFKEMDWMRIQLEPEDTYLLNPANWKP